MPFSTQAGSPTGKSAKLSKSWSLLPHTLIKPIMYSAILVWLTLTFFHVFSLEMNTRLTILFPVLAIAASLFAWFQPQWFLSLGGIIVPALMLIMFAMGLTLSVEDFKRVMALKRIVAMGVLIQYSVMPLIAFLVSRAFGLSNELLVGMVLVGSASGGTASNVICYLARADVALSVSMTMVSTLVAVVALPLLSALYLGELLSVPTASLFVSVLKVVFLPVSLGILVNHVARSTVAFVTPVLPLATTLAIVFVIAIIVALNHSTLATVGPVLLVAVMVHNLAGLCAGYIGARLLGQSQRISRTVAIEVGMQNSGLAVALALKYFGATTALPGAIFSLWHNISGSILAAIWSADSQQAEH